MIAFCSRVPAIAILLVLITGVPWRPAVATPLGTAFTYQGQLVQSGVPANGDCDMQFSLFGAASGGTQIGSTQVASPISLTNGLFTVPLDFGSDVFTGANRFLEIQVRCPAGGGSYVTLSPRQKLTAAPYALYATTAGNLSCTGCVTAGDLASGAVTGSAIDNGTIEQSKLAFSPVLSVSASAPLACSSGQNPTVSLSGVVAVANGGTGAHTPVGARGNLNAAASGANADITSLSGITGNIVLPESAAGAGNILKGGVPFIHNFGNGNTFVGENAGNLTLSGGGDTGVGQGALASNTSGYNNTGLGMGALASNTMGAVNSAVGAAALAENTSGYSNTAVGDDALYSNTTGHENTAVGFEALHNNQTYDVTKCTAPGAPKACCTGAGTGSCEGDGNTAVGASALFNNTTGLWNTAVGQSALISNTTGIGNAAVGYEALTANNGNSNTAVGLGALAYNTTAGENTAVGTVALAYNTTGENNTAVGNMALYKNQTYDVAKCTAPGAPNACCTGAGTGSCEGGNNTAVGNQALYGNTTGGDNTAVGNMALAFNSTGDSNTAVGLEALRNNDTGAFNTAVGKFSLGSTTVADSNTALGYNALEAMTSGNRNTAVGKGALELHTNGTQNTAVGHGALSLQTSGWRNTAVGESALGGNTTGSDNIALGNNAGLNLTGGSNNIAIGNPAATGESNTIRIGTPGVQTATYIAGIASPTSGGWEAVFVNSDGKLGTGTVVSSARFKTDVQDMGEASSGLMKLRPVRFRYKQEIDPSGLEQYGLVAEEVAKVYPDLVVYDNQGQPQTVRYHLVNAMLLNELQKQARQIAQLTEQTRQVAEQAREMAQLNKETIDTLTARVAQLETEVASQGHTPAVEASYQPRGF